MEIADSAYKHGTSAEDIRHAAQFAVREIPPRRPDRIMLIGPRRDGEPLELVILDPDDDPTVIHAMKLRPKFYVYLRER